MPGASTTTAPADESTEQPAAKKPKTEAEAATSNGNDWSSEVASTTRSLHLPDAYTDGHRVWLRQDLVMSTTHVASGVAGPAGSSIGQPQFGQPQPMPAMVAAGGQMVPPGAQMVSFALPATNGGVAQPAAPVQMADANPEPTDEQVQEPQAEPSSEPEPEPEPEPAAEAEPAAEPEPASAAEPQAESAAEPQLESFPAAESADADASAPALPADSNEADAPLEATAHTPVAVAEPPADSPLPPMQPPEPLPA